MHFGVGCSASSCESLQQAKVVPSANVLTVRSPRDSQQHFCLHSYRESSHHCRLPRKQAPTRQQTRQHRRRGAPLSDGRLPSSP
eukprot:COSAG06_NODE_7992_length_2308_cov_4.414667_4_plen_84_part_00